MQVEEIQVEKEKILSELEALKKGVKEHYISKRSKLVRDLLAVYGHLHHGGKIIDIFETFHNVGLKKDGNPKLAIVACDAKWCYLYKIRNGGAIFSKENKGRWGVSAKKTIGDIKLPPETFTWKDLEESRFKCASPIIPPRINVQISARIVPYHYHILFEVEEWSRNPVPPRDPILGKMLTPNLFGVLATWDLTELERKIIRGRL